MSKVLLVGDLIVDDYRHFTATRICPEAPALILKQTRNKYSTAGGAGLVEAQLKALGRDVLFIPVTISRKERIFSDDRLMLRIDTDADFVPPELELPDPTVNKFDAMVISDYGKGTVQHSESLMEYAEKANLPLFVDAKNDWPKYDGAFAVFPNDQEIIRATSVNLYKPKGFKNIIHKMGAKGCSVNGQLVPQTHPHAVRDVSGAGDVFMAGFIHWWLMMAPNSDPDTRLIRAAEFANHVAGISVEYVGTKVVSPDELYKDFL